MKLSFLRRLFVVAAGIVVFSGAGTALAGPTGTLSTELPAFNIIVSGGEEALGVHTVYASDGSWDSEGHWHWNLAVPITFQDFSGRDFAQLGTATGVSVDLDPVVNLFFAVNNMSNSPVNVTVLGPTINFGGINNAQGRASAGMTLTTLAGGGSTIGSFLGNTKSYDAYYNGGTTFTNLVRNLSSPGFGGDAAFETVPPVGYLPIPGVVTSMSAQFGFMLAANSQASGTSAFEIIPEPSTMGLLLIGVTSVMLRRRRA